MRRPSANRTIVATAALVIGAAGGAGLLLRHHPAAGASSAAPRVTSQHGTIALAGARQGMALAPAGQLSGTYHANSGALFYLVTSGKTVLASGNIAVDGRGHFSRNVAWSRKAAHGETARLKLYAQDKTGRQLDNLSVDVTLQ